MDTGIVGAAEVPRLAVVDTDNVDLDTFDNPYKMYTCRNKKRMGATN